MTARRPFMISIVGSDEDLTRVQKAAAEVSEPIQLELTEPDRLESIGARSPDVAVIGLEVERRLPVARQIRVNSPRSEILFLLPIDRLERFRTTLPFVPHLASAWTVSGASDASSLGATLGQAAKASRHRRSLETVLGRINQHIAAGAGRSAEVRSSQLALSERYLATILTQSPDSFLAVDPTGVVLAYNDAAVTHFGPNIEGGNVVDAEFLHADDRERLRQSVRSAAEGEILLVEIRLTGGKELAHAELSLAPVQDENGRIASVSLTARDITERKRFERHLHLLIAELNHRVKNTLAVVQSLAHQTFTPGKPPAEAIGAYEARLGALAAAHNLLTEQNWEAASISDVVHAALQPFCHESCRLSGPELRLPPRIAISLTLALHELATNAQKYGSLSVAEGAVELTWDVAGSDIELCWAETGGPRVQPPEKTGFGTRLLQRALAADLNGSVNVKFEPEGLVCQIRAPIPPLDEQ